MPLFHFKNFFFSIFKCWLFAKESRLKTKWKVIWIFFSQKWKQNQNSSWNSGSHFYQKIECVFHTPLLGLLWNCCRDCLLWCREWMSFPIAPKETLHTWGWFSLWSYWKGHSWWERLELHTYTGESVLCKVFVKSNNPKKTMEQEIKH